MDVCLVVTGTAFQREGTARAKAQTPKARTFSHAKHSVFGESGICSGPPSPAHIHLREVWPHPLQRKEAVL